MCLSEVDVECPDGDTDYDGTDVCVRSQMKTCMCMATREVYAIGKKVQTGSEYERYCTFNFHQLMIIISFT